MLAGLCFSRSVWLVFEKNVDGFCVGDVIVYTPYFGETDAVSG